MDGLPSLRDDSATRTSRRATDERASWIRPRAKEQGVGRYLAVLRGRAGLILIVAALCTVAAGVYVVLVPKQYQTQADLLVTPAPDGLLPEQSLLRDSSDPTVEVESVALLVTSHDVATLARAQLGNGESVASLLNHVQAVPVAGSTVVAITAQSTSPARAQMIANAFAAATIQQSTTQLQTSLTAEAQHLQAQIAALPASEPPAVVSALAAQLTSVEALQGGQDPTLRVATGAALPTSAASPHRLRTVAVALLAGLILGVGVALAAGGLDPVLRREGQLEARYTLPVLAQIPAVFTGGRRGRLAGRHRSAGRGPLVPGRAPPPVLDAYRALLPALTTAARGSPTEGSKPRSILVTSPSALEGKTTTAISLAWSLAAGGHRVILIEADFRRPAIGEALGISSQLGVGTLFDSAAADPLRRRRTPLNLDEALVWTRFHGVEFEVLLAGDGRTRGSTMVDRVASGGARELISLARRRADFVVIDSPALDEAMETLSLVQDADELVLVVALGETRIARLEHLGGLLQRYDVRPAGFVVVGVNRGASGPAYGAGRPAALSVRNAVAPGHGEPATRPRVAPIGTGSVGAAPGEHGEGLGDDQ